MDLHAPSMHVSPTAHCGVSAQAVYSFPLPAGSHSVMPAPPVTSHVMPFGHPHCGASPHTPPGTGGTHEGPPASGGGGGGGGADESDDDGDALDPGGGGGGSGTFMS